MKFLFKERNLFRKLALKNSSTNRNLSIRLSGCPVASLEYVTDILLRNRQSHARHGPLRRTVLNAR